MTSGIILSIALSYNLMSFGSGALPDAVATLEGGYHIGPVYALVSVETQAQEGAIAWAYYPSMVTYDFKLGVKFSGFDAHLSRYCVHGVDVVYWGHEPAGLRLEVSYTTWRGE